MSKQVLPRGWKRIAEDQVQHHTNQARVTKIVYRASGGGTFYRVWYKDSKGVWCSAPGQLSDPFDAMAKAEELAGL